MDFGVTVERQSSNIFKLSDKWLSQQAAVYRGKLAKVPENAHINTQAKLYGITKDQFVEAKIVKIQDGVAEISLIK